MVELRWNRGGIMEKFRCSVHSDMSWPSKLTTQNGLVVDFSKPPEYGGMLGTMTPEDALVSAVLMCLACTFDSYSSRMHIKVRSFSAEGVGTVDRVDGIMRFSRLEVKIVVTIPPETNRESAHKLIERVRGSCLVTASLDIPVEYDISINQADG